MSSKWFWKLASLARSVDAIGILSQGKDACERTLKRRLEKASRLDPLALWKPARVAMSTDGMRFVGWVLPFQCLSTR